MPRVEKAKEKTGKKAEIAEILKEDTESGSLPDAEEVKIFEVVKTAKLKKRTVLSW